MYGAVISVHVWRLYLWSSSLSSEKSKIFGELGNPLSKGPDWPNNASTTLQRRSGRRFLPQFVGSMDSEGGATGGSCFSRSDRLRLEDFLGGNDSRRSNAQNAPFAPLRLTRL